jgi:hypothetical protein
MWNIIDMFKFIEYETGVSKIKLAENTDIFYDLGVQGDDFSEFIESYALQFDVNMGHYLWYFHSNDEGTNVWSFIFKPPNEKVGRIPITPKLLLDFANTKLWAVDYPVHDAPRNRNDLRNSGFCWLGVVFIVCLLVAYA